MILNQRKDGFCNLSYAGNLKCMCYGSSTSTQDKLKRYFEDEPEEVLRPWESHPEIDVPLAIATYSRGGWTYVWPYKYEPEEETEP